MVSKNGGIARKGAKNEKEERKEKGSFHHGPKRRKVKRNWVNSFVVPLCVLPLRSLRLCVKCLRLKGHPDGLPPFTLGPAACPGLYVSPSGAVARHQAAHG